MFNSDRGHAGTLIFLRSQLPAKVGGRVTAAEPVDTAGRRAQFLSDGHERIAPALAGVPGLVRTLVLYRERDAASCVVSLAVEVR